MAKISAGILSTPRGKVAGVVGASWKGVGYIREKVKPANPNTAAQQTQRSLMKNCVHFAQLILADVLIPFVSPFQKHQSGYNWFVKQNIKMFSEEFPYNGALKFTAGTLTTPSVTASISNGVLEASYGIDPNPAASDETLKVCGLVVDTKHKKVYFGSAPVTGNTGTLNITLDDSDSSTDCLFFAWIALEKAGLKTRDVSSSINVEL